MWQIILYILKFSKVTKTRVLSFGSFLLRKLTSPLVKHCLNLLTLISLDIQRDSGKKKKGPQFLKIKFPPFLLRAMSLCLGDWHTELPFFMTWRFSRHFCFRPSNFTAS